MTGSDRIRAFAALALIALILLPALASAHNISVFPTGYWGSPLLSCTGSGGDPNVGGGARCTSLCDLIHTLQHIIYFALTVLFFVLVPAMVMYGGIIILTSAGSSEKVSQAKSVFGYAAIGLALGLGAYLIVNVFFDVVQPKVPGAGKWYQLNCSSGFYGTFKIPETPTAAPAPTNQ